MSFLGGSLLQRLITEEGDTVGSNESAGSINGSRFANSTTSATNSVGRTLRGISLGELTLGHGEIWVFSERERSWDSRHFGPVLIKQVVEVVEPLAKSDRGGGLVADAQQEREKPHELDVKLPKEARHEASASLEDPAQKGRRVGRARALGWRSRPGPQTRQNLRVANVYLNGPFPKTITHDAHAISVGIDLRPLPQAASLFRAARTV